MSAHIRTRPRVKATVLVLLSGLFVVLAVFGSHARPANAAASSYLNFQMRLLSSSGAVVADGDYNLEFKIYDSANSTGSSQGSCSGDANCLWVETRTGANKVRVVNGYLSVKLGSVSAFGALNWDQEKWLGVRVGGTGSPSWESVELTSDGTATGNKIQLTAVPLAFAANKLATGTGSSRGTLSFASLGQATDITLPDPGSASATVCYQNATACGFAPSSGGTGYVQLQGSTPGSAQTGNFNVTGKGIAATFQGSTSVLTPLLDSISGGLTIGTSSTGITLNQATTVASGRAFTANGTATLQSSSNSQVAVRALNAAGTINSLNVDTTTNTVTTQILSSSSGVLDSFTRADEDPLSGSSTWTTNNGTIGARVVSNEARGPGSGAGGQSFYNSQSFSGDSEVFATFKAVSSGWVQLNLRYQDSATPSYYFLRYDGTTTSIQKVVSGSTTSLTTTSGTSFTSGDILALRIVGTTLTAYKNNVSILSTTDSAVSAGGSDKIGIHVRGASSSIDDFGGGLLTSNQFSVVRDSNYTTFAVTNSGKATFQNVVDSTAAFQIQNSAGTSNLFIADTTNTRIGIGASPANSLLTIGTNSTTAAGGIIFGTDTNLYRSAADTLKTDDSLIVASTLSVQGANSLSLGAASSNTGSALFRNSGGSGSITVTPANPGSSSYTLTLPAETGTVCSTASLCSGYNAAINSAVTYYVAPSSLSTCIYNGDGGTGCTPSDSNTGLTKALPFATIAAARDAIAKKTLGAAVTIQLANTTGGTCYRPQGTLFENPTVGKESISMFEVVMGGTDAYPTGYIYIKGDDTTPANVVITGASSCGGTASSDLTGLRFSGTTARVSGLTLQYFGGSFQDSGGVVGYKNTMLYAENLTGHSDNKGSMLIAWDHSMLRTGGTFTVSDTQAFVADGQSMMNFHTPAGATTLNFSGGASFNDYVIEANEDSRAQVEYLTANFTGTGSYAAFVAFASGQIYWNGDSATNITINAANAAFLEAHQFGTIWEGCGSLDQVCTFTAMKYRAYARDSSTISYTSDTTTGSSANVALTGSTINAGNVPMWNIDGTGQSYLKPTSNTDNLLQIQNAIGTTFFNVDSNNRTISVGDLSGTSPGGPSGGIINVDGSTTGKNLLKLQTQGSQGVVDIYVASSTNTYDSAIINTTRSRGTVASPSAINSGDDILGINANGYYNSSSVMSGAEIKMTADAAWSGSSTPGRITFGTHAATSPGSDFQPIERLRIDSSGNIGIGTTQNSVTTSAKLHVVSSDSSVDLFKVTDQTSTARDVFKLADGGAATFRNQTDSSTAFQIQTAGGTTLFSLNSTSSIITISGTTSTFVNLTLSEAHFKISQTNAPTIGTPTNCGGGTGPSAAVTAGSADNAGSFTITAGTTGSPTSCDTVFTFNKTFGAAPKAIIVTPSTDTNSTGTGIYVSASSATTFTVKFTNNAATSTTYTFYYWVVE